MSTVESLISSMAMRLHGKPSILVDGREVDLTPPYPIIEVVPFLERKLQTRLAMDNPDELRCQLLDALSTNNNNKAGTNPTSASLSKLFDLLISEHIEPLCWHPTYIAYHPRCMSPLAAPHPRNALLSDRFELFIQGTEIANAYSELNDPIDQALQFALQSKRQHSSAADNAEVEDCELPPADEHYLQVMQAGMPPTAGCGIGVDRLVMLMTDQRHIRDVTLFPLH